MFTFLLSDYSVTSMIHMDETTEQQLVGGRGKCYNDWLENFRMSNATFLFVCNELRSSEEKNDITMRKAILVEQQVALHSLVFVNRCTFSYDRSCMCDNKTSLHAILLPKYIQFPNSDGLREVVDGFKHKFGWC